MPFTGSHERSVRVDHASVNLHAPLALASLGCERVVPVYGKKRTRSTLPAPLVPAPKLLRPFRLIPFAHRRVISVVIPAYNEARALPATLDRLERQRGRFEIIVVDGGSTDETAGIARGRPDVQLTSAVKGRASQMNAGARLARGECLLFLHADTLLPEGALARLDVRCTEGHCQAGGFHQRFSGDHWQLRVISWLHNTRCRFTRIFYGDQALFVQRDLFWSLGGFPAVPILEDVLFGEKLRRVARPVLLDEHVVTDSRKFEQRGIARSFGRVLVILLCHELRLSIRARAFFDDVR